MNREICYWKNSGSLSRVPNQITYLVSSLIYFLTYRMSWDHTFLNSPYLLKTLIYLRKTHIRLHQEPQGQTGLEGRDTGFIQVKGVDEVWILT